MVHNKLEYKHDDHCGQMLCVGSELDIDTRWGRDQLLEFQHSQISKEHLNDTEQRVPKQCQRRKMVIFFHLARYAKIEKWSFFSFSKLTAT